MVDTTTSCEPTLSSSPGSRRGCRARSQASTRHRRLGPVRRRSARPARRCWDRALTQLHDWLPIQPGLRLCDDRSTTGKLPLQSRGRNASALRTSGAPSSCAASKLGDHGGRIYGLWSGRRRSPRGLCRRTRSQSPQHANLPRARKVVDAPDARPGRRDTAGPADRND